MHKSIPPLMLAVLLTGCAVGPQYQRPATPVDSSFHLAEGGPFTAADPEARWWSLFNDATLDDLVRRAIAGNRGVRVAEARLGEARALRRESLWAFAPQGGVSGTYQRRDFARPEIPGITPAPGTLATWSTGFDATWEIDLFGRLRRSAEASQAEVGRAEAEVRGVQVALLAEVAANHFGWQGRQQILALLRQQRELLAASLETTRRRVTAGRGSPLDIARAEALLRETEALIPPAERESREHLHRLAVLLGETPGSPTVDPVATEGPVPDRHVDLGTPAGLLRRRPDVVAAERQLAAATARLGVRTAEMFPEVSVSGFIRLIGADGVRLGSAASQGWGLAPTATWHLLSLGRLNAIRQAGNFQVQAALALYEETVLRALEDLENALARYRSAEERLRLLTDRQAAAERALRIAQSQHAAGAIGSLETIDAERTALAAARETVSAAIEHRLAVVALYKALGGGWEAMEAASRPDRQPKPGA